MSVHTNQLVPSPGNLGPADSTNYNGIILASESRAHDADPDGLGAGVYASAPMANTGARGVNLFISTESAGAGTVTVKVQIQDPVTRTWSDLAGAVTTALADPADSVLQIYPGATVAANVAVSAHLGLTWRVHATVATAAVTFSVGAVYLL